MFESDYIEFKSKAEKDVKDVVFKSIEIYKMLEDKEISYYSYSIEKEMSTVDKYSFATFIALLDSDKKINDFFKERGITIEKIANYLDVDLADTSELYPDQLESEFIHGYRYFLHKVTNDCDWNKINTMILLCNVTLRSNNVSTAIESFLNDYLNISDVNKELFSLDEDNSLEDIKPVKEKSDLPNFGYYLTGDIGKNIKGREKEIRDLEASLIAPGNVIVIGEAGVGKTAVVEHLAYLINHNRVPNILKDKKIFFLDLVKLMANTTYRGDLEAKLDKLISSLEKGKNTILFIDEIHMIMGAGKGSSDNIDVANIMKSYLSNRKIQIIGATTTLEYEKYILEDKAFRRRFNKVVVDEPNDDVLYEILNTKRIEYENKLNIRMEDADKSIRLLIESTRKSHRDYSDNLCNPTLSLNILGRSFAYTAVDSKKSVTFSSLADSILSEETLYKGSRENCANKLKKAKVKTLSNDDKIIRFPKK